MSLMTPVEQPTHNAVNMMMPGAVVRRAAKPKVHDCIWPSCTKAFNRRPDMIRHVKTVHEKKKDYHCLYPGCYKSFAQSATLATHENVHTGDKPWECCFCKRGFGDQSSRARHQREQHTGMTHYCPYCTSTNKRPGDFKRHLDNTHSAMDVERLNLDLYKLPQDLTVDDMEYLPQFNQPGMKGLESRRKAVRRGRRGTCDSSSMHFSDIECYGLIPLTRTPSNVSMSTTPSLTTSSISPSPSPLEAGYDAYPSEGAQFYSYDDPMGGNALGVNFTMNCNDGLPVNYATATDMPAAGYVPELNHSYGGMQQNHFIPAHPLKRSDSDYMADISHQLHGTSGLLGHEQYEYHDHVKLEVPAQCFAPHGQWDPFMTPISQLARSTHAQASAWGPVPHH